MSDPAVTHRTLGERTVVRISGDLDFASVNPVTDELERVLAETRGPLVLDLSDTGFVDSAGIKLLYELHAAMQARGTAVGLVVPPQNLIHRTLLLTGAEQSLAIYPSLEQATAAD